MLNVLQIVVTHARAGTKNPGLTGPERRAANLAGLWKARGIHPVICYPSRGNLGDVFRANGLTTIDFEIGSKFNFFAVKRILQIAREQGCQLIHTQGPAALDVLAVLAGRLGRIPVVVTRPVMIEDQVTYSQLRRFVYSFIDRHITLRLATRTIAVSEAGFTHLRNLAPSGSGQVELIWNGVDLSRFGKLARTEAGARTTIVMVAQLVPLKGWRDFIATIGRLVQQGHDVLGLIVGEGAERAELESLVRKQGLEDRIEFTGFVQDVATIYSRASFVLFTSRREGLSVAIIEALASGLPVVATQVGGIREQVVPGWNGFIVEPGDVDQMVQLCEQLILEPKLLQKMARNARALAFERFDETRMLDQYVRCYLDAAQV